MKPLLFSLLACFVPASLPSSFVLFVRAKPGGAATFQQPFSFNALRFPVAFNKTTDTLKQALMTLPDDNRIFEKVEIEAAVDTAAWRVHLQKYLQPFFDSTAADIPVGSYTVDVRFVVEMDGRISSVTAITDPGYGLAKVSANAIREGPRWKPGEINTCFVRSYHTQPITFMVTPDECDADTAKEAGALPPHMITPKKCEADTAGPLMFSP